MKAGARIHTLERYMNTQEGVARKDDTLPPRLLQEGRLSDKRQAVVPLKRMLDRYYSLRGFSDNGIPLPSTLEKLGIPAVRQPAV